MRVTEPGSQGGDGRVQFVKPGRAATSVTGPGAEPPPSWSQAAAAYASPSVDPARAAPFQPAPAIPGANAYLGPIEIVALAGIGVGFLLPGPGLLAGIVAVLISQRWTAGEKALVIIGPIVLIAIPFVAFMNTVFKPGLDGLSSSFGWLVVMCVVSVTAWPGAAIYLWVKARRRQAGVGVPRA